MIAEDQASGGPPGCVFTIRQASSLLTVPVSTLRSWERRYDVPMTARTTGGHRRYTKLAIDELRLMRDEIARGKRAGDAAVSARLLLQPADSARPFIDAFLAAAQAMQPARIRVTLDDANRELGIGATMDEVLMPAVRRIGRWWETGRCDVGHEHLMTEAARTWLGKVVAFAPEPPRLAPVVLACGPHDTHTLGLEALGALLVHGGRQCCLLGARTPVTGVGLHPESGGSRPRSSSCRTCPPVGALPPKPYTPWPSSVYRPSTPAMLSSRPPPATGCPAATSATASATPHTSSRRRWSGERGPVSFKQGLDP